MSTLQSHLSQDALLAYWLRETGTAEADAADEHLMRCDACGQALDELVALGQGVARAFRAGVVWAVSSRSFVQQLASGGLRVREYHLAHNGSVHCTVAPDDDLLVSRLSVPLQGVRRLDVACHSSLAPGAWHRLEDVPFDADAGEVVWLNDIARIRPLAAHTLQVKLLAVEADASRELGTYTFRHRPWPGWTRDDAAVPGLP